MAIPQLVMLLNDHDYHIRLSAVSALTKLAGHGVFIPISHLDIANLH
jgi:hypothetical protein